MSCCSQNFLPGDEISRSSDSRLGWIYRIKPTGVRNAIVIKWQDNGKLEAFFNQSKCDQFTTTGNKDHSQTG